MLPPANCREALSRQFVEPFVGTYDAVFGFVLEYAQTGFGSMRP